MSKKDLLDSLRNQFEEIDLSNGWRIQVRKLMHAEFTALLKSTDKLAESTRGLHLQARMIAKTTKLEGEELTEEEVTNGMPVELVKEIGDHVARVNGMDKKAAEEAEGN